MGYEEDQSRLRMVLMLEEARVGDPSKLDYIKKTLNSREELAEGDKQYIEDTSSELKRILEHQTMVDWAANFINNLKEKHDKKSYSVSELQHILEKEKNKYKMNKKFNERVSTKIKEVTEQERRLDWTFDLISKLKQAKVGDGYRLDQIERYLKVGTPIDDKDRHYLMEHQKHLKKVSELKNKAAWSLDAVRKIREAEIGHLRRLESIRRTIDKGEPISESDQRYLDAKYEKLRHMLDAHNRIEWTKRTIERLSEFGMGDKERLAKIKKLLDEEVTLSEDETGYIRKQHRLVQQAQSYKRKLEAVVDLVDKLQENEVGDYQRLEEIRQTIEERKHIPESEISYLKEKYRMLDIITKSTQNLHKTDAAQTDAIDYVSVLNGLNESITKSEEPKVTVSKQYF